MVDINRLSSSQSYIRKQPTNPNIKFTGHEIKNGKVTFFTPGKKSDEGKASLTYFKVGEGDPKVQDIVTTPLQYQNGNLVAEVPLEANGTKYAYEFTVNGKTQVDLTEQKKFFGTRPFAITRDSKLTSFDKPHQIYHVLPDSFNPKDTSKVFDENGNFIWRNHFDLYGGNIKGVIEKLDYVKELGTSRIMGTPIFGADDVSCHGYWTQNPYQIASNMGNANDFNTLNIELFKKGMGWIADGAFVNQGLMGVQFQDVMRRSAKDSDRSPFMEWFTFPNEPGQDFDLGILPQNDAGDILYDKFDIAFENAPVDKKGQSNPDYDETKPTYLKVFDSRQAKQANISFDSIQNYKFAVDPEELKEKFDYATEFETDGRISNSELVEWGNFNLATSDYDSGKLLWDGNRDVLKMNMQNPDVRKYIMGAGTYWTTKVDNTLLNYVSSNINKVLNGQAPDADKVKNAIAQLEKSGVLPQGSSDLTKADIAKAMEDEYIAKTNFTLHGSVKAFPPESIELPREILGVVTNPYFKKQLESLIDSNSFKSLLKDIIKSSKLSETNQQKLESPEIIRLFSEDIAKAILTKAITGVDYVPGQTLPEGWHKQLAEGAEKTLPPQFLQAGPSVAADLLITTIKQNIKNVDKDKIAEALNPKVEQVDTSTVRAAKALLTKMESGLDWRIDAAKDVADMDGVRNGRVSKEEAFKFVSEFWAEFCDKVRNVNPKAFIVGEVTDVPDKDLPNFVQNDGFSTLSNYRYMFGTPYKFVHAHPEVLGWHDGPTAFFNELENFAKAWPVTAVNTAHNMVDNHDKTRVLQNLLIHPGEFKDKGPEFAMAQLMKYALTRAYDVDKKNNTIEKLTKTDPTFAKVYKAIDETAKREGTRFGYWSMDRAIPAVLETAGVKDSQLAAKMSKVLFDDATDKYLRCLYLLVGVPGAPEIYAGTEFAMTGGETISKNVFNQNRNPIPWVWLNGKNAKSEVVDFNNSVKAIFNLRNNKNLSVLNNGFIKDLNHKDDENGILAFLRYNSEQQAIVILNNGKVNQSGNAANLEKGDLTGNLPVTQKDPVTNYEVKVLDSGIDTGTVFINGENSKDQYIVWSDGILRKKPEGINNAKDIQGFNGATPEGLTVGQGLILYRSDNAKPKAEVTFAGKKALNLIG